MKKISVIGLDSHKDSLMKELMKLGVVEISTQNEKLSDDEWSGLVSLDDNTEQASLYDSRINKVTQALEAVEKYAVGKKPLFFTRKPVARKDFETMISGEKEIWQRVDRIMGFTNEITEIKNNENRIEMARLSLLPWQGCDIPLTFRETKYTQVLRGVVPATINAEKLRESLEEKTPGVFVQQIGADSDQQYLSVLYLKKEKSDIEDALRQFGFNPVTFPETEGTAAEAIQAYDQELVTLSQKKTELEARIREEEAGKTEMEYLHDSLIMKRDHAQMRSHLLVTDRVFCLEGFTPRAAQQKVEALLLEKGCYYEFIEPEKDEETPVLLHNGAFSAPFEAITKLYALPDSRGIDATPFFSFSYAVFFGMMLSDAAYGLIIVVATFIINRKYKLEGMMGQLMKMFFYCGISTVFWGIMFGGYFGDLITVVGKTFFNADIVIPPVMFNPVEEPMTMMMLSFVLGAIHIFLGMGINAYMSIRDGKPWDALFDVGFWYVLLVGLVLWLGGMMGGLVGPGPMAIGKWMSIGGALGILLTGGRDKKGLGRITGGLGSLYNITSYLADVLSYSRLLALGLATGVIASVINILGSLGGGGFMGAILMLIAFVIGHTYNMAINALGSFVHSSRLEYVEFFGKFYESGGDAFVPFMEKTKYVEILREEN